ncbi:MAG: LemA family protein, partial [Chthoniobacterales bacterium]
MATGLVLLIIIALISFFALMFVIGGYNALVSLRNRYKNAFSQIDVQLKRRYDLIPNLVETAK